MAQHLWTILCSKVTEDRTTNNLSIIDIIEEIGLSTSDPDIDVTKLPGPVVVPISCTVVSNFVRSDRNVGEKTSAKIRFVGPTGGPPLFEAAVEVDLTTFLRRRCLVSLQGLPLEKSGPHRIEVQLETTANEFATVMELPIEVSISKDPSASGS
jgi:hypothetical protein